MNVKIVVLNGVKHKRKASGKKVEHQLIAENIDTRIIMQSLDSN